MSKKDYYLVQEAFKTSFFSSASCTLSPLSSSSRFAIWAATIKSTNSSIGAYSPDTKQAYFQRHINTRTYLTKMEESLYVAKLSQFQFNMK